MRGRTGGQGATSASQDRIIAKTIYEIEARRDTRRGDGQVHPPPDIEARWRRSWLRRFQVATDQRGVEEEADPDCEGDDTERCGDPGIVFNAADERKGHDVSESSGHKQDSVPPRPRSFREVGLEVDINAT